MYKAKSNCIKDSSPIEAIISKEEFEMVHGIFQSDTRIAPEEKALYLFSGFVKCGYCNGNMTRKTVPQKGKKYIYLVCVENKNKSGCPNHRGISLDKFEQVILEVINLQIEKVFELKQMLVLADEMAVKGYFKEKLQSSIEDKEMEMEKKRRYSVDSYQDYKEGLLSKEEYLELKDSYHEDMKALLDEIKALKREYEEMLRMGKDRAKWMQNFIEYRGFQELTRELLLQLVKEIKIYGKDRIEVVFQFQEEFETWLNYCKFRIKNEGGADDGESQ